MKYKTAITLPRSLITMCALSIMIGLLTLAATITLAHASEREAQRFIENLGNNALSILSNQSLNKDEKETKLVHLFLDAIDSDWIAEFTLGKYWNESTKNQQETYKELYKKFLVATYVSKFEEYTNETFSIEKSHTLRNGGYFIETQINRPNGIPLRVSYRVQQDSPNFKIKDIIAEGVSLITTQRTEFSSVASKNGVGTLIKKLDARIKRIEKKKPNLIRSVH